MRLPVNVRNPRITSATIALVRKAVSCAGCSVRPRKYSAVPTSPAASPPNACDRAVRWGTAVRGTSESGTPTMKPATIARVIQPWWTISGWIHVAATAITMPVTPATTPRRAVRSEEHTSELQSRRDLVCRLLLEKKKKKEMQHPIIKKKKNKTERKH